MRISRLIQCAAVMLVGFSQFAAAPSASAQDMWGDPTERSLVFNPNAFNSRFYRIPALATAADGSIIAVADKRIDNIYDLPNRIDVVVRRSEDNGRTWSEYITVAEHDEIGGYGDPAIVLDEKTGDLLIISTHGNGLWQETPGHISISRSKDNGKTWLPAVDINDQILTIDPEGPQPIKCVSAFASSGRALQLADGRLMFVLIVRQKDVKGFSCYAIYSDDGGNTWQVSKNPGTYDGDESKVVELADGTVIMSIRNRYKGKRLFSVSHDRGETWSEPYEVTDLIDPACNGDILRYTYGGKDILLQSLPGDPTKRENVTIYASLDNGATWPISKVVVPGMAAYSALTVLPDGTIGILTEEAVENASDRQTEGYRLWFTRMPLEYIMGVEE